MGRVLEPGRNLIKKAYQEADDLLNAYVENRMRYLMAHHASMTVLLKCMGELTAYDRDGHSFAPKFLDPLQNLLEEFDTSYNCRTGHPLKITRDSVGKLKAIRNW